MEDLKELNMKEKICNILDILKEIGLDDEQSASLISNNLELIHLKPNEIKNKISIIYNHNNIYAVLFCNQDEYKWSIHENGKFSKFISSNQTSIDNRDYIIELVISFLDNPKIQDFVTFDENDTLENKINKFKTVKVNEQGYHIK